MKQNENFKFEVSREMIYFYSLIKYNIKNDYKIIIINNN